MLAALACSPSAGGFRFMFALLISSQLPLLRASRSSEAVLLRLSLVSCVSRCTQILRRLVPEASNHLDAARRALLKRSPSLVRCEQALSSHFDPLASGYSAVLRGDPDYRRHRHRSGTTQREGTHKWGISHPSWSALLSTSFGRPRCDIAPSLTLTDAHSPARSQAAVQCAFFRGSSNAVKVAAVFHPRRSVSLIHMQEREAAEASSVGDIYAAALLSVLSWNIVQCQYYSLSLSASTVCGLQERSGTTSSAWTRTAIIRGIGVPDHLAVRRFAKDVVRVAIAFFFAHYFWGQFP
ncbi:hypothetical protein C8R47DRAFT_1084202 [Mycena vitilis]|nr:hypothetical protein C8R47DRAFT_1084202 [Mycena vitilis]